ncbi:11-beta-hydroxysteroid dehydrogenase 1B-like protein [Cinnamomum micranthum f. kanehirae]|uniref:11-beta-hydroxysteroid dehydrogenase 1B-like protein n=1 Tax=Cinnamomum micranthum f. kanehirae TaxID=337451 RepID=A0A443P8A4_9MAGN|nr:11-beta-hydroxysteroid dehydrogenase 1B-like protein [Cinnamomum micranthum f. kanehirae]
MEFVNLCHIVFTLFFPPLVILLLLLSLPPLLIYRLFHTLLLIFFREKMTGKVALITGASSGIGEQMAYQYAKRGASLVLVARRERELRRVAENSLRLGSPDVIVAPADVTKPEDCKKAVDKAVSHFGQLNHVVANAGILSSCLFEEVTDITSFKQVMDVNFWGGVYPTYYAIPHLQKSRGNIVVTASIAGRFPISRLSFYNASKAAVIRFFETLRTELSPDIKVTIATPGYVESELTKGKLMLKEGQIKVDKEARDVVVGPLPIGNTEKCAKAIVDSACKGERYVTWPSWYRALHLVTFLAPEVLDWYSRTFYMTEAGNPQGNALSKKILDMFGASLFYPASIESPEKKPNQFTMAKLEKSAFV